MNAEARGYAVALDAIAAVLLQVNPPDCYDDLARVCAAIGADLPHAPAGSGAAGGQVATDDTSAIFGRDFQLRIEQRLFVNSIPCYVPLTESCVKGAIMEDGTVRYGSTQGPCSDHVLKCYHTAGFDFRALDGSAVARGSLKPDSLASELAFLAFLKEGEHLAAEAGQDDRAASLGHLASDFAGKHVLPWTPLALEYLREGGEDYLCDVVALADSLVFGLTQDQGTKA